MLNPLQLATVNKVWSSSWLSKWCQPWRWQPSLWHLYFEDALNHSWFLIFLVCGVEVSPMNTWLMKGCFDTVPMSLDESTQKTERCRTLPLHNPGVLPLVRPMIAVQALWTFMGPFRDYILSSFLLCEKEYFTVAVGLQTSVNNAKNMKIAYFSAGAIPHHNQSVFSSSSTKRLFVSGLTSGGDKGYHTHLI